MLKLPVVDHRITETVQRSHTDAQMGVENLSRLHVREVPGLTIETVQVRNNIKTYCESYSFCVSSVVLVAKKVSFFFSPATQSRQLYTGTKMRDLVYLNLSKCARTAAQKT